MPDTALYSLYVSTLCCDPSTHRCLSQLLGEGNKDPTTVYDDNRKNSGPLSHIPFTNRRMISECRDKGESAIVIAGYSIRTLRRVVRLNEEEGEV